MEELPLAENNRKINEEKTKNTNGLDNLSIRQKVALVVLVISGLVTFFSFLGVKFDVGFHFGKLIRNLVIDPKYIGLIGIVLGIILFVDYPIQLLLCSIMTVIVVVTPVRIFFSPIESLLIIACVLLIILGVALVYFGAKMIENKLTDNFFFIIETFMAVGGILILCSVIKMVMEIATVYKNVGLEDPLTGASIIVTVITSALGLIVKIFMGKNNKKQEKQIALHKEMDWRKELHKLEKKGKYQLSDLIKINSFINPYHKKETDEENNIDYEINETIVKILKEHKIEALNEEKATLFDFELTDHQMNEKLDSAENQELRQGIHKLLKWDWDLQTK